MPHAEQTYCLVPDFFRTGILKVFSATSIIVLYASDRNFSNSRALRRRSFSACSSYSRSSGFCFAISSSLAGKDTNFRSLTYLSIHPNNTWRLLRWYLSTSSWAGRPLVRYSDTIEALSIPVRCPVRSAGRGRFQAKSNKDSCFDPKYCCLISWSFAVSLRIFEAL